MPEQDRTYLQMQTITIPCDRRKHFEDIPITLPAGAHEGTWTFAAPSGNFQIRLTLANGKISGELIPGAEGGNCCLESLGKDPVVLPLHFPDLLLQITLSCPNPPPMPGVGHEDAARGGDTWLCLDIGNTRTCALLDLPDPEIAFYKVINSEKETGVFNSLCAAQTPTEEGEGVSFVVLGKTAAGLRRDVNARDKIFSLSTPKRFFWDDSPDARHLRCVAENKRLADISPDSSPFIQYLSGYNKCEPTRQLFMQGAILELLERAEDTLRELRTSAKDLCACVDGARPAKFENLVKNLRIVDGVRNAATPTEIAEDLQDFSCDFVTDLVCTCPAAWLQDQRRAYRELIEDAVNAYCTPAKKCHHLELHMECDEATAVLLSFFNRIRNGSDAGALRNWFYDNGKLREDGDNGRDAIAMVCRVGVLDVGGGTSDLSISELAYIPGQTEAEDRLEITPVGTNGTDRAGDFLLLQITLKILVPMVAAWLLKSDSGFFDKEGKPKDIEQWKAHLKWFRSLFCTSNRETIRFARMFWFELAVAVLGETEKNSALRKMDEPTFDTEKLSGELDLTFDRFWGIFKGNYVKTDDVDVDRIDPNEQGRLKKDFAWRTWMGDDKTFPQLYRECIETALGFTARMMSATLLVNDCDLVLFSGKTMENHAVQEFFKDYLPMRCFPLEGSGKEDTAKGAEYYVRRDELFGVVMNPLAAVDESFYWVAEGGSIVNDDGITRPPPRQPGQDKEFEIVTNRKSVSILRRKFESIRGCDIPCYRLCNTSGRPVDAAVRYTCKLKYNAEVQPPRLQFLSLQESRHGVDTQNYPHDQSFTKCGDWELKICTGNAGTSWLDTGIITEEE